MKRPRLSSLVILLALFAIVGIGAALATAEWLATHFQIRLACPALPDQQSF